MRVHFGISKRISIKKLIEIIGFIFIVLLGILGIKEVNAEELTWNNLNEQYQNFSFGTYEYLDYNDNFNTKIVNNLYVNAIGTYHEDLYISNVQSSNSNNMLQYIYAMSNLARSNFSQMSSFSYNYNQIMQKLSYKYTPSSTLCENNTTDLKSINFKITLSGLFGYSNTDIFNIDSSVKKDFIESIQGVRIVSHAINNGKEYLFSTKCNLDNIYNNIYSNYTCSGVFNGNSEYNVDYYLIEVHSIIPFNNLWSNSNNVNAYITSYNSLHLPRNDSNQTNTHFQYSCSNNAPNFNASFDVKDDPAGLNDIYDTIKGNYSSNLPGINTNNFVDIPSNFTDLLTLPLDVIHAIVNNSTGTCENYSIDMSSIVSKWGNINDHYYLQLPCMREVLSNKLGSLYTLCDLFFCFVIFYNIAMHIVRLLNALTYGEDLFTIFYQPMEPSVILQSSSEGSYTRRRSWFE